MTDPEHFARYLPADHNREIDASALPRITRMWATMLGNAPGRPPAQRMDPATLDTMVEFANTPQTPVTWLEDGEVKFEQGVTVPLSVETGMIRRRASDD